MDRSDFCWYCGTEMSGWKVELHEKSTLQLVMLNPKTYTDNIKQFFENIVPNLSNKFYG